jgi:hypothetical protein
MISILSYPIRLQPPVSEPWATAEIEMPDHARIIRVGLLGDEPTLWVIGHPHYPRVTRQFAAFSSGDLLPPYADVSTYIGGWVDPGVTTFSWELFEVDS